MEGDDRIQPLRDALRQVTRTRESVAPLIEPHATQAAPAVIKESESVSIGLQTKRGSKPIVFIGHGHTELWRALRDFVRDDLGLAARPFEQDSHVGEHIQDILESFAKDADCAIMLLTMDDPQADDALRARQNVIHEVGFFQASVGFRRVAMVIEDGVEGFSNVAGTIHVPFRSHHIDMTYEPLRKWLRREGMIA